MSDPSPKQQQPAGRRRAPCVLVTNDDGPPCERHSPFLAEFVALLQEALLARAAEAEDGEGGRVMVCVPAEQQSWVGKSMSRWDSVVAHRGWSSPAEAREMAAAGRPLWCLVRNATPATACHLALTQDDVRPPFRPDLVVSGPNFGRNAGRSCILSSGTVGAALEAVLQGVPALALSVAFGRMPDSEEELRRQRTDACRLAVSSALRVWDRWADGVPLYNVNLPLGVAPAGVPVYSTHVLRDSYGTIFRRHAPEAEREEAAGEAAAAAAARAAAHLSALGQPSAHATAHHFGAANFGDLSRFEALPDYHGSDIWALAEGAVSVTPLHGTLAEVEGGHAFERAPPRE